MKEATLYRNFRARARQANVILRIPSVTSRWSCSKTDNSNCCSHETLFHEATCEFKRLDAVNYALNSGIGKTNDDDDDVDDETSRKSPAAQGESKTKETQTGTKEPQADPGCISVKNNCLQTWESLHPILLVRFCTA